MCGVPLYCSLDAMNQLVALEYEGDTASPELTVHLIELPFLFRLSEEGDSFLFKAFLRGELYSPHDGGIEKGSLTVNKKSGEARGSAGDELLSKNMGAFYRACRNLGVWLRQEGFTDGLAALDPEEAGLLVTAESGVLSCRRVSGAERPDLMCQALLGGARMARPYRDEEPESTETELLPLAERLARAGEGDEAMMEALALSFFRGDGDTEPDPARAAYWMEKLAERNHPTAQFNLALLYAKGWGVERSFENAAFWMEKAAQSGDEEAAELAADWFGAAADAAPARKGNAAAQARLAAVFMSLSAALEGRGGEEELKISRELAERAAAQGDPDGRWTLALCYEHGRGVAADRDRALALYREGAEAGHAPSLHSLACALLRGDGVEADAARGFSLAEKAAAQGYGPAWRTLGACWQFGEGTEQDLDRAEACYEKALALQDDPELAGQLALFKSLRKNGALESGKIE